jgi:hypothetical protein
MWLRLQLLKGLEKQNNNPLLKNQFQMKGNKGRMGKGMKRGKGKGKGEGGEGLLGKGKEDGMYSFMNCSSSVDHFLQKNISREGREGSQSKGTC